MYWIEVCGVITEEDQKKFKDKVWWTGVSYTGERNSKKDIALVAWHGALAAMAAYPHEVDETDQYPLLGLSSTLGTQHYKIIEYPFWFPGVFAFKNALEQARPENCTCPLPLRDDNCPVHGVP